LMGAVFSALGAAVLLHLAGAVLAILGAAGVGWASLAVESLTQRALRRRHLALNSVSSFDAQDLWEASSDITLDRSFTLEGTWATIQEGEAEDCSPPAGGHELNALGEQLVQEYARLAPSGMASGSPQPPQQPKPDDVAGADSASGIDAPSGEARPALPPKFPPPAPPAASATRTSGWSCS